MVDFNYLNDRANLINASDNRKVKSWTSLFDMGKMISLLDFKADIFSMRFKTLGHLENH